MVRFGRWNRQLAINAVESRPASSYPGLPTTKTPSLSITSPPEHDKSCLGWSNPSRLSWRNKIGYSLGVVIHEFSFTLWSSYIIIFLYSLDLDRNEVAILFFLGQSIEGFSMPVMGMTIDRGRGNSWWGRKKLWYLGGSIMLAFGTPTLYLKREQCFICDWGIDQGIVIAFAVVIMKLGYTATQTSHSVLMTELTHSSAERVTLNTYRQVVSVISGLGLYGLTYYDLHYFETMEDLCLAIQWVARVSTLIGIIFALMFLVLVQDPSNDARPSIPNRVADGIAMVSDSLLSHGPLFDSEDDTSIGTETLTFSNDIESTGSEDSETTMTGRGSKRPHHELIWSDWFKKPTFWKVAFICVFIRSYLMLTQTFQPLYVKYTIQMNSEQIPIMSVITYITGFVFSFAAKALSTKIGIKGLIAVGTGIGMLASNWSFAGSSDPAFSGGQIHAISSLLGIRGTFIVIGSVALCADLIGNNKISGGFVFSFLGLLDKAFSGAIVGAIVLFSSDPTSSNQEAQSYKLILGGGGMICGLLIMMSLITIARVNFGKYAAVGSQK